MVTTGSRARVHVVVSGNLLHLLLLQHQAGPVDICIRALLAAHGQASALAQTPLQVENKTLCTLHIPRLCCQPAW